MFACDVHTLSDIEEERTMKAIKIEHVAVDKSSLEQWVCKPTEYTWISRKNWSLSHSATASYGRLGV